MDAPPIRYVTTSDGFKIAYSEKGAGPALVWMPFIWSSQKFVWTTGTRGPLLHRLAEEYRIITYDARGQGCSSRDLGPDHSIADYQLDLEALVDTLGLDRFVLYGWAFNGRVALDYASQHPKRVAGLILRDLRLDHSDQEGFLVLGETNWEMYVETMAHLYYGRFPRQQGRAWITESYSQPDWLRMSRSVIHAPPQRLLNNLDLPALVLVDETDVRRLDRDAVNVAAAIPGARLIMTKSGRINEGLDQERPSESQLLEILLEFLHEVVPPVASDTRPHARVRLSPREREVLRLIAAGRSTREISDDLVLSERTVARHITNLYGKIGARSRAEATAFAIHSRLD